jgi:type II secretory pathway pseudopilin PulG
MSRDDDGFLLLETLIAFVIAGLALAVLYRAAFGGAASVALAGRETTAIDRAESRLAALRAMAPTHHYVRIGADGDGFHYRETADRMSAPAGAVLVPMRLEIRESWQGGHSVTLATITPVQP